MPHSPLTLRGAATVQAAEAVVVLAATILAGVDAAKGQSYHVNSGIALTVIGAGAAVALAWVARGLAKARKWSRTPALLTQLFVGIVGIYLLQGHRLDWGLPSVLLAALGFATILAPPSHRALVGTPQAEDDVKQAPAAGPQARTRKPSASPGKPAAARSGRKAPAPAPGAKAPAPAPGANAPAPTPRGKASAPAPGRKRPAR
jgi:hypothetical protein